MIIPDTTTIYFLYFIGGISTLGLFFRLALNKNNKLIVLLPNIAVSVGILGTFWGVFIGLQQFNVSDISGSIPKLLEGLKTAFTTSIAGIFASIILKLVFEIKSVCEESKHDVKTEDPIDLLKSMVGGINSLEKSSREIESSIVSCFRSDEEYSLISQLKLIRQEIVDTRKEVSSSFKDFAEQIAESSTDALVEALEKVVGDFNTLLSELVGESFKELSTSMIKLNEWQENYKTHVDETQGKVNNLINQMTATVKVLDSSSSSIDKIDNSLESIDSTISGLTVSAEDISAHIESLSLQNETLREGLTSIKQVGDEAKTVMPTIETQINNLTNKLESTVLNVAEKFESSSTVVTEFVDDAARKIGTASDCHSQTVQKFIEGIDEGLEMELSKAMNIISSNLGSLSAKFVEDYMPLTDRLREIVRLPEKINA